MDQADTTQLYSMKEACALTGLSYDTLKFYCNHDLVPNVKRGENKYRYFDDNDITWIKALNCLKSAHMSIAEMQHYTQLCLVGKQSIPERLDMLAQKERELMKQFSELKRALDYINTKRAYFFAVQNGEAHYVSSLTDERDDLAMRVADTAGDEANLKTLEFLSKLARLQDQQPPQ